MSDTVKVIDNVVSPLLLIAVPTWTIYEMLLDVKVDGVVLKDANILNPRHDTEVGNSVVVYLVAAVLLFLMKIYRLIVPKKDDELKVIEFLNQTLSSALLISAGIMNGVMRTPSTNHVCPNIADEKKCDIATLKYDDDVVHRWLWLAFTAGLLALLIKLSQLLNDLDFSFSNLIATTKETKEKSWAYIVLTLLALIGSFVTLLLTHENDVKTSKDYDDNLFLSLSALFSLVAVGTHVILIIVTLMSNLGWIGNVKLSRNTYVITRWVLTSLSLIALVVCSVVLALQDGVKLERDMWLFIGILYGAVFLIFCLIDFIRQPSVLSDVSIEFIALNEIPLLRFVVVVSTLSLLSLINGVLMTSKIPMVFLSASILFVFIADLLGKNEF